MTAAWRTREELAHQVALLAKQGDSQRAIARALGVSRNTERDERHGEIGLRWLDGEGESEPREVV